MKYVPDFTFSNTNHIIFVVYDITRENYISFIYCTKSQLPVSTLLKTDSTDEIKNDKKFNIKLKYNYLLGLE